MSVWRRRLVERWEHFFFAPRDRAICDRLRVAYAAVLLVYVVILGADLELFFSQVGLLPYDASRTIIDPDTSTLLLALAPNSLPFLWGCYGAFLMSTLLLLFGVYPRVQAALVFLWLVSFQHRNILLLDGEDCLFRMFAFFLIFMPSASDVRVDGDDDAPLGPWALRLVQIQLCLVYFSAGAYKLWGNDWTDGNAFYYFGRLDDLYGLLPAPHFPFESAAWGLFFSWIVIVWELSVPFTLWLKRTRRPSILIALAFHATLAWSMNLFLFQYVMAVGLIAFTNADDWKLLRSRLPF